MREEREGVTKIKKRRHDATHLKGQKDAGLERGISGGNEPKRKRKKRSRFKLNGENRSTR